MAIKNEIVFDATDRTGRAFASIKNAIADIAESGQKAQGSMGRFLQLSPRVIALGTATAGAAAVMRGIYQNSEELKGAASKLGVAWDSLMSSMAKSEAVTKVADGMKTLAENMTLLADKPKEVATFANDSVLTLSKGIEKLQDQIATKSNYGDMAFWLPSVSELHTQLDALTAEVVKKSIEANELISDLRKRGLDPTEFVQLNDAAWASIIFRSEKAFAEMKKQENDAKKHKEDVLKAYEKVFAESLDEQSKLSIKYAADSIDAVSILEFDKKPATKKRVNEILLRLDQEYLDASAKLVANSPPAPDASQIDKNKSKLDFLGGDTRAAKAQEQLAGLIESLRTEEQVIADSYAQRQFIIESAFQEGAIPSLQEYNDLSTQLWAENEANKTRISEEGIKARHDLAIASNDAMFDLAADGLGALSSLFAQGGKKAFEISKALAIGQTIISTYAAAQKAYESQLSIPDPSAPARAAVAAGIAIVSGLARVAAISNTSYGSRSASATGGGSSGSGGGGSPSGSPSSPASSQSQPQQQTPIVIQVNVNGSILTDTEFNEVLRENLAEFFNKDGVLIQQNSAQARAIAA